MVRAKLDIYYTFRVVSADPLQIQCMKWEEFSNEPLETYKILPHDKGILGGCDCPAWKRDCKHLKRVLEAIAAGKANEFWKWQWSERGGWEITDDIDPSIMDTEM